MMELKFITKLDGNYIEVDAADLNIKNKNHVTVKVTGFFNLKWNAHVLADSQKISALSAQVPDQDLLLMVEVETELDDGDVETETKEITLSLKDAEVSYTSEDVSESVHLGLMPISIERYRGRWSVVFCTHTV